MLKIVNLKLKRQRDIILLSDFPQLFSSLGEDFIKNRPAAVKQQVIGDENYGILFEYFFSGLFYSHTLLKQLKRLDGIIFKHANFAVEHGWRQLFICVR